MIRYTQGNLYGVAPSGGTGGQGTLFGEPGWVSRAEDVILDKRLWNRISPSDRQRGDAAGVVAVQAGALDNKYLSQWAGELNVGEKLERLLKGEIKPKKT